MNIIIEHTLSIYCFKLMNAEIIGFDTRFKSASVQESTICIAVNKAFPDSRYQVAKE